MLFDGSKSRFPGPYPHVGAAAVRGGRGEGAQGCATLHRPGNVRGVSALTRRLGAPHVLLRSTVVPFERPTRLLRAMVASVPWGLGLAGGVAAACARYPERNAVVDDEGALTYGELWRRSDGIAHRLIELGARRGTAVGVLCRNHRGFVGR